MKAVLSLTGNQREGYEVKLELPAEWLKQFTPRMNVSIWGEKLSSQRDYPPSTYRYDYLKDARATFDRIEKEIQNAKEILKTITETSIVHEVDVC